MAMNKIITIRINQQRFTLTIDFNPIYQWFKKIVAYSSSMGVLWIGKKSSKFRLFYYNHTKKYDWGLVQFIKDMDNKYPSEHKTKFEEDFL